MNKIIKLFGTGTLNQSQINYVRDMFLTLENIGYFVAPQHEMEPKTIDVDVVPSEDGPDSINDELRRLMPKWKQKYGEVTITPDEPSEINEVGKANKSRRDVTSIQNEMQNMKRVSKADIIRF